MDGVGSNQDFVSSVRPIHEWVFETYEDIVTPAREEMVRMELDVDGSVPLVADKQLAYQQSIAGMANVLNRVDHDLQEACETLEEQGAWGAAGESALAASKNLWEAAHYLGLLLSTLSKLVMMLNGQRPDAYQVHQLLFGARLQLERLESHMNWAAENTAFGLEEYYRERR